MPLQLNAALLLLLVVVVVMDYSLLVGSMCQKASCCCGRLLLRSLCTVPGAVLLPAAGATAHRGPAVNRETNKPTFITINSSVLATNNAE
jgi:hypothetical protein